MTDQTVDDAEETDGEDEGAEAKPRKRGMPGKKLVLFIFAPILLLAGAGAGVYFSGLADPYLGLNEGQEAELASEEPEGPSVYYDLPDMLVNLNSTGRKASYLKISVSLELASEEDFAHLERVLPRVVDNFQVYLRELRVEDLRGSAGLQRLREELLFRVGSAAEPVIVRDVLFREMLVQ